MRNPSRSILIQKALHFGHNNPRLTENGPLAVETGKCTGRSSNAKYIVVDSIAKSVIDWDNNQGLSEEDYEDHKRVFFEKTDNRLFYEQDLFAGFDKNHRLPVRIHTIKPWHSLFAKNMFFNPSPDEMKEFEPDWNVYSAPFVTDDPKVVISFSDRVILISGTDYAGEIKKSVFTVLNFILPHKGVLPMHCSVSVSTKNGAPTIFFGLSGTGKTTLSSDDNSYLVGDDEHGWSDAGLFNFEGGCYAKTIRLSKKDEPLIYDACNKFGTILENVVVNRGCPDFDDASITENTRASYPLSSIGMKWAEPQCGHPTNVIMLTCDANGVLPPVAKLNPRQAVEQFLLGYTAKIAGTELGITEPVPTFSHCFGSPFMPLRPKVYADLLSKKIAEEGVNCWLVNTGWINGPYGVGRRIPIETTRNIINSIIWGSMKDLEFKKHVYTDLQIPKNCDFLSPEILNPEQGWDDMDQYKKAARSLMSQFIEQLKKMTL